MIINNYKKDKFFNINVFKTFRRLRRTHDHKRRTTNLPFKKANKMENLGYKEGSTKPRRISRAVSVVSKSDVEQPLADNNTAR